MSSACANGLMGSDQWALYNVTPMIWVDACAGKPTGFDSPDMRASIHAASTAQQISIRLPLRRMLDECDLSMDGTFDVCHLPK